MRTRSWFSPTLRYVGHALLDLPDRSVSGATCTDVPNEFVIRRPTWAPTSGAESDRAEMSSRCSTPKAIARVSCASTVRLPRCSVVVVMTPAGTLTDGWRTEITGTG